MSPALTLDVVRHWRSVGSVLFGEAASFSLGWPAAARINWPQIVSSHTRLGYLAVDLGVIAPLCYACLHGLGTNGSWAPLLFLVACGAMAFDFIHFVIYLMHKGFLGIPAPIYGLTMAIALFTLYSLALREFSVSGEATCT